MDNVAQPTQKEMPFGPLVGIIIIVGVIIFGGVYFYGAYTKEHQTPPSGQSFQVTSTVIER